MTSSLSLCFAAFSMIVFINSCKSETGNKSVNNRDKAPVATAQQFSYRFISPLPNQAYNIGKEINVSLQKTDNVVVDSLILIIENISIPVDPVKDLKINIPTKGFNTGSARLKLNIYHGGSRNPQIISLPVKFLSDIVPKEYTYRIINEFPHDRGAYTQGFEYQNGYFFEGTGQRGESYLRKTVYNTGEIIKSRSLSSDLFGEGITLLNGKIYQVTYQTQVGFIYDIESFEQLQKIYYQNREGWGLTNNGKDIIMSDGTHVLYFMDPDYFSVLHKIEVYDNIQEVDSLNELEYINGLIYANRFLTDQIVIIDPLNGKVVGKADMSGLLKAGDRQQRTDVLNGIAWDNEKKALYVTGKYWPKVFQVQLIPK